MKLLITLLMVLLATPVFADDHSDSMSSGEAPVELWVCKYKDGKTIVDLRAWYKDFNVLSDKMDNPNFRSWLWTPYFVSELDVADVVVATAFPNLESMGQSMQEFFGGVETGALFARYESIVACDGRELWMVEQMRD